MSDLNVDKISMNVDLSEPPASERAETSWDEAAKGVGTANAPTSMTQDSAKTVTPSFNPWHDGPTPPLLEPRLAEVAKIADPHLRQQVEANVRLQTQREIADFTDGQRQAKSQAKAIIDQGGDLSSIPGKLMLQIDVPGRQALHAYAAASANPATDPVTYYRLKNQALDDPAGFRAADIANHMAKLAAGDYRELLQLQMALKSGQLPADLPLLQAYKASTDHQLQLLGLPIAADNNDQAPAMSAPQERAARFRRQVDLYAAADEIASGRRLTIDQHRALLEQIAGSDQFRDPADSIQYSAPSLVADSEAPHSSSGSPEHEKEAAAASSPTDAPDDSGKARRRDILNGGGGNFIVTDNPKANDEASFIEWPKESRVHLYGKEIDRAAKETGIDADLIRAIMFMETTHGYYDGALDMIGKNKSILPMNINVDYWGDFFGTREQLHDPYLNILAGARMLQAIENNMPPDTSIAKIATIYQNHRARSVSDYGARVSRIYRERLWEKRPAIIRETPDPVPGLGL